jgi:polar amino acid transport system ATP-binding protein
MTWNLPVIDVAPLVAGGPGTSAVAEAIGRACRDAGFFYVIGHGVDPALGARLEATSRRFFAQDPAVKERVRMALGGRAWRGWFPLGGELTSGVPDDKEGLYFGAELPADDPRVVAGLPLHGPNLFPDVEGMRETVLAWLDAMTRLGHALMRGIALSLGLDADWFHDRYTRDPLILFRAFHYPGTGARPPGERWGVGEHTDYGVLTILKQDAVGGLEVRSPRGGWVEAPPLPDALVCNIGDMLDRMTRGLYRSTPHRVRNRSERARLSFPFFFDPALDAEVRPIDALAVRGFVDDRAQRWDRASVHDFEGSYGDYLLAKIAKVFPELRSRVL